MIEAVILSAVASGGVAALLRKIGCNNVGAVFMTAVAACVVFYWLLEIELSRSTNGNAFVVWPVLLMIYLAIVVVFATLGVVVANKFGPGKLR